MHAAAARGHSGVVDLLLQNEAIVDEMNSYGNTPLHIACLNGHKSVCVELLYRNANINAINYRGQVNTNLFYLDFVPNSFLRHFLFACISCLQTPLHIAAASTDGKECMEQLLLKGADINAQSDDGRTPLHMTCHYGRFTCSKILIDAGAEVDKEDKNGCTALHIAALYGHDILTGTLLSVGADPRKPGYQGNLFHCYASFSV